MIEDQELCSRLASDLDAHFEQVVRTFQDRLYGFALRLTHCQQDAEEATQDAFIRAYRALEQYPPERRRQLKLRPWLYQIALNVVRNRVRRPAPRLVQIDEPSVQNGVTSSPNDQPEKAALDAERQAGLAQAIAGLPSRYAAAVVLRHVQGLSYAEAAEVLDQPVGTTKSDVHRGLRLLRESLLLKPELLLEAGSR
jgi:RNA polymerase sigma-70 factor (ECF subfamily)